MNSETYCSAQIINQILFIYIIKIKIKCSYWLLLEWIQRVIEIPRENNPLFKTIHMCINVYIIKKIYIFKKCVCVYVSPALAVLSGPGADTLNTAQACLLGLGLHLHTFRFMAPCVCVSMSVSLTLLSILSLVYRFAILSPALLSEILFFSLEPSSVLSLSLCSMLFLCVCVCVDEDVNNSLSPSLSLSFSLSLLFF